MFSGIIKSTSKPNKIEKKVQSMRITFSIPRGWKLNSGESINIDGVCSTVEKKTQNSFSVYYMPETLKKTSLSSLDMNHMFNLEQSLTLQDLIGGHLVSGHVDTTAQVAKIEAIEESKEITFKIPKQFSKYLIYKGSVAINGVSLTVVTNNSTTLSVSLIPYTLNHTNLGTLRVGSTVNIEVDLIAKYLEKLAHP